MEHPPAARHWPRLLLGVLLALQLLLCLVIWSQAVPQPHQMDMDEVQAVNLASFWRHGVVPYFGQDRFPAAFNPWGPAYTAFCGACWAVGLNPYVGGRLASLLAVLLAGALVITARPRDRRAWFWVLAAAVLFWSLRPAFLFAFRCRADAPTAGLGVLAFVLLARGRGAGTLVLGVVCAVLATLCKITTVAAPLAAWYLLRPERPARAWVALAGWLLPVLAGLAALQLATHGLFWESIARPPDQPGRALEMASRPFTLTLGWTAALLLAWRRLRDDERGGLRDLALYGGLAYAVAVVTGAGWGSHWGYLLEFYAAGSLVLAAAASRLAERRDEVTLRTMTWLLCAHLAITLPYLAREGRRCLREGREAEQGVQAVRPRLAPYLASGARFAVVDNWPAQAALLDAGRENLLDVVDLAPFSEAQRAEVVARSLNSGRLDLVLSGPGLAPWDPRVEPDAPGRNRRR